MKPALIGSHVNAEGIIEKDATIVDAQKRNFVVERGLYEPLFLANQP